MKKIQLIYPPNDLKYSHLRTGYQSYPPPSGLEIMASYIQKYLPELKVEIFDGNVTNFDHIVQKLDADIIGMGDWFTNHNAAMKLAYQAKKKNPHAKIIVGGPNAANLNRRILINHPYVDAVVYGDGEQVLLKMASDESFVNIPNIWYRDDDGNIRQPFKQSINLNDLPIFDFEHLVETDLQKYDSRSPLYSHSIDTTPVPISSIRGCIKASKKGACTYCSMPKHDVRIMDPSLVWKQIRLLNKKYGIRDFFETGDNFIVGNYPRKLLDAKPRDIEVSFRIYAIPGAINSDNIDILTKLGVEEVFIGVESTDHHILGLANKEYDVGAVESTVRLLNQYGIRVFLPFLFGLPGENKGSLSESYNFALHLIDNYNNVQRVLLSLAIPLVGTKWFNELLNDKETVRRYDEGGIRSLEEDDDIEYERLILLSLHKYCEVSFSDIYDTLKRPINERLRGRVAGFGCLEDKILGMEEKLLNFK